MFFLFCIALICLFVVFCPYGAITLCVLYVVYKIVSYLLYETLVYFFPPVPKENRYKKAIIPLVDAERERIAELAKLHGRTSTSKYWKMTKKDIIDSSSFNSSEIEQTIKKQLWSLKGENPYTRKKIKNGMTLDELESYGLKIDRYIKELYGSDPDKWELSEEYYKLKKEIEKEKIDNK